MINSGDSLPCVAHLLRPAQGGMRELVRTLLKRAATAGTPSLLLAPQDTLDYLSDGLPDPEQQYVLRTESVAAQDQLAAGQRAGKWAKRSGAQLLHGHGLRFAPLFASASLTSGLPLVVTLHNLVPPDLSGMQKVAARAALSRASTVIAVSHAVAESVAGLVSDASCVVIPNGIELNRFEVSDKERLQRRTSVRVTLGVVEETPVILCVSRLSPEKDISNLIEAACLAFPAFPTARLFIVGEGRLRKTLEMQITLLGLEGRVILQGERSRETIPDLLFAADIFALSSREEGLSLAVLEAEAAGLPVVATNIGGLPEAVAANESGLLVSPRDPALLAKALSTLIADPAQRAMMGNAGRKHVAQHFSEDTMIAATFAVYRRNALP